MNIAILGYGTVGSGVAQVLHENHAHIVHSAMDTEIQIKYILDLREFPDDPYGSLVIHDFDTILHDPSIGVVVETMGGTRFAYPYVKACLEAGKSVVTSNKELVAMHGYELLRISDDKNVNFLFEASVGGGIPIVRPIYQCLAANEISEVVGILNGTTNFMLTKMVSDGMPYEAALRIAQELGYAEKDPTADVEGHDACRKICILAALAFGKHIYPDQVATSGISQVTYEDTKLAQIHGCAIKLIGRAKRLGDGRIFAEVAPMFVPKKNLLASVDGVYNAIQVRGNAIGDVLFYGRGAGKEPTASAVVADIIDCCKHTRQKKFFGWDAPDPAYVAERNDDACADVIQGTYNSYCILQ
ncbi:MAG: homoserine dehydrogenase [Oscillospiraceae bacterium]|jgi:homoserine dehydrogenase|nr:homoserine dehydrogenase [Oscillospiraceae bacterium]